MSPRLVVCLLLFCVCLPVAARDVKMSGANGDGSACPDHVTAGIEDAQAVRGSKRTPPAAVTREKSATTRGSEAENVVRPPRWHSFRPGMFR
ncbi:hypothetical protein BH23PSE2_BH23PSE2_12980 [soil metagenome]